MNYKLHKTTFINLLSNQHQDLDFPAGILLISHDKFYIHWLTESGKIRATLTVVQPTTVKGSFRIINGSQKELKVQLIHNEIEKSLY